MPAIQETQKQETPTQIKELRIAPMTLENMHRMQLALHILGKCDGFQGDDDDFVLHPSTFRNHMFLESSHTPYTLNDLGIVQAEVEGELPVVLVGPKETMAQITTETTMEEDGSIYDSIIFPLAQGGDGRFMWLRGGKHKLERLGHWHVGVQDPKDKLYPVSSGPIGADVRYVTNHFEDLYESYVPWKERTQFVILGARLAFEVTAIHPTGKYNEVKRVNLVRNYIIVDLPKE